MTTAYAALANGGRLLKPNIIDKVIHSDGSIEVTAPTVIRQVVSEETSKAMGTMLRSVVVSGHGKRADVPGYLVGGKTGTAQVAKTGSKGYEEGMSIGSFIGYAPIHDPKFVVLVKLDNPKNVEWAESSAAPTFGQIMKFLLEYAKVQPTEATTKP
jgi:stage V sporulation protein D (sporulation-specific penicillin-binding protein)